MNLNPLYELKERLESSVIAGVSLLSEDFRLVRAVEQMEPLSKVSPIFEKIFHSAQELLSDTCTNKGDTLLDILAFVNAVLTTQAVSNVDGEVKPLTLTTGKAHSDAPYSLLAPILEALTTSGSGHYSLLINTHSKNPEIFSDYRLKSALVAGLNASYAELAENIEGWLSEEDASILPLLKMNFDPKGKKEMVRRVHIIEAIAKEEENDWYLSTLENAEKDVRAALIRALRYSQENKEILIGFTKTEKGNCKKAALWSLAKMKGTENLDFWEEQIKKNLASSAKYLALSTSDGASDLIAEEINKVLDIFQNQVDHDNPILSNKDIEKLQSLLETMIGKASPKMIDLYRRLASDNLLKSMKTEKNKPIEFQFETSDAFHKYATASISAYISEILIKSLVWNMDQRLSSLAEELYQEYGEIFLQSALTAALLTKPGKEVYDTYATTYATVLIEEKAIKKEDKIQKLPRFLIMNTFSRILWSEEAQKYQFSQFYCDEFEGIQIQRPLYEKPDIRWFELFTNPKLKKLGKFRTYQYEQYNYYNSYASYGVHLTDDWDIVMQYLICPTDEKICKILADYFYQRMSVSKSSSGDCIYYPLLKRCGFIGGKGLIVKSVRKSNTMYWMLEKMLREAPMSLSNKMEELKEIKSLVDSGQVRIAGFNNNTYQMLYTNLVKELEQENKERSTI